MTSPACRARRCGRRLLALSALLAALGAGPAGADEAPPAPGAALDLLPHRSRLGLEVQTLTPELREHFGAPEDRGLLVSRVETGRPAAEGGVRAGDVLLEADGAPLQERFDLVRTVARVPAGSTLALRVLRDGEVHALALAPEGEAMPWIDPETWRRWAEEGLREGSSELRRRLDQLEQRLRELERELDEPERGRSGEEGRPT